MPCKDSWQFATAVGKFFKHRPSLFRPFSWSFGGPNTKPSCCQEQRAPTPNTYQHIPAHIENCLCPCSIALFAFLVLPCLVGGNWVWHLSSPLVLPSYPVFPYVHVIPPPTNEPHARGPCSHYCCPPESSTEVSSSFSRSLFVSFLFLFLFIFLSLSFFQADSPRAGLA